MIVVVPALEKTMSGSRAPFIKLDWGRARARCHQRRVSRTRLAWVAHRLGQPFERGSHTTTVAARQRFPPHPFRCEMLAVNLFFVLVAFA